ncbi:MAG: hypothetical protein JWN98_511 [Abditibacteriota bacterium]|nr:hypothetical protein [Abditibacteriota bacterium]
MPSLIVILNPASGSSDADFKAAVESALQSRGAEYELRLTTPEISAAVLATEAVRDGAEHIIACGGDGTIMSVVNGLATAEAEAKEAAKAENGEETVPLVSDTKPEVREPQVTLSIVPGGTANLVATALGISSDVEEAVATALVGEDRVIDLGRCGEHRFALGLGLGLTERLVSQASARDKERFGKLAYGFAMLRELGARPHNFRVRLDGGRIKRARGVAVVVANAGDIGGKMQFAPRAEMDDAKLDLCILHRFYFRDLVRMFVRLLLGQLPADRAVSFFQARRIEIHSDPPLDLQIDGEVVDQVIPLVAEVLPRALKVRVPPETLEKEAAAADSAMIAAAPRLPLIAGVVATIIALWVWRRNRNS